MSEQKEPLVAKDLTRLEYVATSFGKTSDTYKVFMILRYTGQHISVINTSKYNLHEEIDEEEDTIIVWKRPKKGGVLARTSILKHRNLDFNVGEFAKEVQNRIRKKSRQYLYELIKNLGTEAGLPNISPMTFRHSLAIELLNNGGTELFVAQILNCSKNTLKWYAKYADKTKKERLKEMGW